MSPDASKPRPSFLDRESSGGAIAREGFRFQDEIALSYIPEWLGHEGFTEMISEVMGDVEAKFFVPGIGFIREFIEVKDHSVTPSEFWREIGRFHELHAEAPGSYRWFTLVSCGLSDSLHPLRNSLRRLRGAYGFYDKGSAILEHSYADFEKWVLRHDGRTTQDARFLFEMVLLNDEVSRGFAGEANFMGSMTENLPEFNQVSAMQLRGAVSGLRTLLNGKDQRRVSRTEIEACFAEAGGFEGLRDRPVCLEVSAKPRSNLGKHIEFDWPNFFGGEERKFPPPEEWVRMIEDLSQTKEWIVEYRKKKHICLSGEQRLPVFMAIGSVFAAVAGFVLEYRNRDGVWKTNAYPGPKTYSWKLDFTGGISSEDIAVSIGVMKNIKEQVCADLDRRGLGGIPRLHLFNEAPLVSAEQTNAAVEAGKREIGGAVARTGAKTMHLYVAGPAHLALFLGHRLKAICDVQTYVWAGPSGYSPACRLIG
jgi:hypothetical protein